MCRNVKTHIHVDFRENRHVQVHIFLCFVDKDDDGDPLNILGEKDVTPVGMY